GRTPAANNATSAISTPPVITAAIAGALMPNTPTNGEITAPRPNCPHPSSAAAVPEASGWRERASAGALGSTKPMAPSTPHTGSTNPASPPTPVTASPTNTNPSTDAPASAVTTIVDGSN